MKKLLLTLSITSALGLTGCGGDSLQDVKEQAAANPILPAARVVFDPSAGKVSVPNDLLFSGTVDGTLNMPGEVAARKAGQAINYVDPQTAFGALDGWSMQQPFSIALSFPAGFSLDAGSVGGDSVEVYEMVMGGDAAIDACTQVPRGAACVAVGKLTYGLDYVAKAVGNNVVIIPIKPFKPATTFMLALNDKLKDNQGRPVQGSTTYELVSADINQLPLGTPEQLQLQGLVNSFENAIAKAGANKDSLIYTAAFTTQSAGKVLETIKKIMAATAQQTAGASAKINMNATGLTVAQVLTAGGVLNPADANYAQIAAYFSTAQYLKGSMVLPQYLGKPVAGSTELSALANTYWTANCDSGAIIAAAKAQMGENFPATPISENDGLCNALSGGALRDLNLDKDRHLTKYNTIPKVQSYSNVEVQMTLPDLNMVNAVRAGMGLEAIAKPAAGWPVVILQHGITSKKEAMLLITAALSVQGMATIAIDHPYHGSRGIDNNGDDTVDFSASDVSATHYMNLSALLATRDNLRQSVADMLALRLGINFSALPDVDVGNVTFLGHSLGAITGSNFLGLANTSTGSEQLDALYAVKAGALASPGGGLANFLVESKAFGNLIKASVALGLNDSVTQKFQAFIAGGVAACASQPTQESYVSCAYPEFVTSLTVNGDTATLTQLASNISQFQFASQTILDSADPLSLASYTASTQTPIYASVILGDGLDNPADEVIPPVVTGNPIVGSMYLAKYLGLETVVTTKGQSAAFSALVPFAKGHHGTILSPAVSGGAQDAQAVYRANQEMQLQVATYLSSQGKLLPVKDSGVIAQ